MKKFIICLFTSFLILQNHSFASTRADVASRSLSEKDMAQYIELQKTEQENIDTLNGFSPKNPYHSHLIFNQSIHHLSSIAQDSVEMEDGSIWGIKSGAYSILQDWKSSDPILIIINDSFISSYFLGYKYKMINAENNTSIAVKLNLGPVLTNPKTLLVQTIDLDTNEVVLSNNTLWQCDSSDHFLLEKWLPSDAIIIGSNSKGFFYNRKYDNILINVNMLQEIKANRIK